MPSSSQKYRKVPTSADTEPVAEVASAVVAVTSAAAAAQQEDISGGVINRNSNGNKIMAITVNLPSTNSSQQLMGGDAESVTTSLDASSTLDGAGCSDENKRPNSRNSRQYDGFSSITYSEWFTVGVLCFVNLINYMDRFTIAGVLDDIQNEYKIADDLGGLLQTAFVLSYMICAPFFGYLGDRYSRRWIMMIGVFLWSGTTFLGSFMPNYGLFLTFRTFVGIGEASYSTIAPTIISDLFVNDMRSKMLAMFYFAIPVGSGFGYIIGSETARAFGKWQCALRVTPILGVLAVILIYYIREPDRGQSEGTHHLEATSYKEDLVEIAKNPSFMLSTAGFTCVAFVTGALAWWGPKFMYYGLKIQPGNADIKISEVSFRFGAITMTSGIIGVPLGTYLAQKFRKKSQRSDPIICAIGLITSAPLLAGSMVMVSANETIAYILVFLGEIALNLNWAIVADILLYVVMPTRRSTAEAFQILISHTFGDAGSPYLVGVISESLKAVIRSGAHVTHHFISDGHPQHDGLESLSLVTEAALHNNYTNSDHYEESDETQFKALQYALFTTSFVEVLGGIFFLLTAIYIIRDKQKVETAIAESQIAEASQSQQQQQQTPPQHPQAHYAGDISDELT